MSYKRAQMLAYFEQEPNLPISPSPRIDTRNLIVTFWQAFIVLCGLCLFSTPVLAGALLPVDSRTPSATAQTTDSGIAYEVLKQGTGKRRPKAKSIVTAHYTAWQASDGVQFDSSFARSRPFTAPLNRVIKGWTEGMQLMTVGEKTRFWIPADLAYGNDGTNGKPTGTLIFDVELIAFKKGKKRK